jgi:hypothetical protein
MPSRDWEREYYESLAEEARREESIFWNKALAKRYLERGVAAAVLVVLTYYVSGMTGFGTAFRQFFLTISLFGAMIAASLMLIGFVGLAFRRKELDPPKRPGEPPPIGW